MTAAQRKSKASGDEDPPAHTDWLERTATIVSALIVATLFALLIWDAVRPHRGAELETRAGDPRAVGDRYYLEVSVENHGDRAVRDVEVDVSLTAGDSTDRATFTLDWVAGKSTRHGIVVLPRDPSTGRVRASVTGFAEP